MHAHRQFFLLRPQQLPCSRAELVATAAVADCLNELRRSVPPASDEEALGVAQEALHRLDLSPRSLTPVADDPEESPGNRANDQTFHIVRVTGPTLPLLVHSTLQGFIALLEEALEAGANLTAAEWARLRTVFAVLFQTYRGELVSHAAELQTAALAAPPPVWRVGEHSALQRWRHGHYMFMVVIQGLVVLFNSLRREIEAGDFGAADALLGATTHIMTGVGPALRFAGDFAYSEYEKEVRPTLMPPAAPPGLSGLYWRDHEYLMKLLGRMRPMLMGLAPPLRHHAQPLHDALASAYESHKLVCSSFVGSERSSLLMASRTQQPAVETLDHFKRVRTQLLKPSG